MTFEARHRVALQALRDLDARMAAYRLHIAREDTSPEHRVEAGVILARLHERRASMHDRLAWLDVAESYRECMLDERARGRLPSAAYYKHLMRGAKRIAYGLRPSPFVRTRE